MAYLPGVANCSRKGPQPVCWHPKGHALCTICPPGRAKEVSCLCWFSHLTVTHSVLSARLAGLWRWAVCVDSVTSHILYYLPIWQCYGGELFVLIQSPYSYTFCTICPPGRAVGLECSSVGRTSDWHAAESGLIPQFGKGFFSQSQLSVQILLQCPYSHRVQSHALTSVCTWKTQTLAAIPLFGHTKIPLALLGMGSSALAAAVALPR